MDTDPNLLFGKVALELGLITPAQWAEIEREWREDTSRSIADLMIKKCSLTETEREKIESTITELRNNNELSELSSRDDQSEEVPTTIATREPTPDDPTADYLPVPEDMLQPPTIPAPDSHRFGARYRGVEFYREGGIGQVSRGYDVILGREVALKELRPKYVSEPSVSRRFLEEARITARLQHPNIVPTHDLEKTPENGPPFYSMRFVNGPTLKEAIRDHYRAEPTGSYKSQSFRQLLVAFLGTCNAIAYAHSQNVIHRDLKGGNIILGPFGESFLLDWGLAKELDSDDDPLEHPIKEIDEIPLEMTRTMPGHPIGTLQFMPPEQALGKREEIGKPSDIFGLGAVLYMILTGHAPYEDEKSVDRLRRAQEGEYEPPTALKQSIPAPLESICLKAMNREPIDRYISPEALADDIKAWLADEPVKAHKDGHIATTARWARKHQPTVAGVGALLLSSTIGLSIGTWMISSALATTRSAENAASRSLSISQGDLHTSLDSLMGVLDILIFKLAHVNDPEIEAARKQGLQGANLFVTALLGRHDIGRDLRKSLALQTIATAKLHASYFEFSDADRLFRKAVELRLGESGGTNLSPEDLDLLAEARIELAEHLVRRGYAHEAEAPANEALESSIALRKRYPAQAKEYPKVLRTQARALLARADSYIDRGLWAKARADYAAAITCMDEVRVSHVKGEADDLLNGLGWLGRAKADFRLGENKLAEEAFAKAMGTATAMAGGRRLKIEGKNLEAVVESEWARMIGKTDQKRGLEKAEHSITLMKSLVEQRPNIAAYKQTLAECKILAGDFVKPEPGLNYFEDAIRDLDKLNVLVRMEPIVRSTYGRARLGLVRPQKGSQPTASDKKTLADAAADLGAIRTMNGERPEVVEALNEIRALLGSGTD